ncbi:MAG: 5-oxoprolinase subunit PxpB [Flavobacteriaceae bacterium]
MKYPLHIRPFGSRALLLQWPNRVDEAILDDILEFRHFLTQEKLPSNEWETIPVYHSLTLVNRVRDIDAPKLLEKLQQWYRDSKATSAKRKRSTWLLPVCYDSSFGLDLEIVCDQVQLSKEQLIMEHTNTSYLVYGIGFLPGFMYLGGLSEKIIVPRKKEPRLKVEKGAVGLAAKQTGIYPQQSPGGWNIIGNCPVPIFNPEHTPPTFVAIGDRVKFHAISKAEHELIKIQNQVGIYTFKKEPSDA